MTIETEDQTKKLKGVPRIMQTLRIAPEGDGILLFTDQFGDGYAAIDLQGSQVMRINSHEFERWLFNHVYEMEGHSISENDTKSVIKILEHKASQFSNPLAVRVARIDGDIFYDLANGEHVRISKHGWEVTETDGQIIFRHFKHQLPQVTPVDEDGNLDDFIQLVNISDRKHVILLKVFLVAAFIPGFPHPVLVIQGTQGSSKSTLCRFLKNLIDPSSLESDSLHGDNDIQAFIQKASHHWFFVLDNLSFLSDKISDVISRICTGGGLSKRKLYTDDEDFVYNIRHIIAMNGITQVVYKPDLLDRSLIIQLDRIEEANRVTEEEIWKRFNQIKPSLLGKIFNSVASALSEFETVKLDRLPRMADFAKIGCAIAKALGYTQEEFLQAFEQNTSAQIEAAVEGNPVAAVIAEFMEGQTDYLDTPGKLYKSLTNLAEEMGLQNSYGWPKAANAFTKQFPSIQPVLQTLGLKIETWKSGKRQVKITRITKGGMVDAAQIPSFMVQPVLPEDSDDSDGKDDTFIFQ